MKEQQVHVVVMGCGRVGSTLARSLEKRGHTVAVIDINPDAFRRLGPDFQGRTVKGMGFDRAVLEKAGIRNAAGFAAVSSGDNSNVLAARVVRETFDIDNVVSRIYDQDRAEVYERLGIATVAAVRWASDQVLQRLLPESSEPLWRDTTGEARLIDVYVHPDWIGHSIADIEQDAHTKVAFLTRFSAGIVPEARTLLQDGDRVLIAVTSSCQEAVEAILSAPPRRH
ncbi:MAG: potassium channel family protein [Propionibacteriaceae bacterium]